jgi:hypothetical protein
MARPIRHRRGRQACLAHLSCRSRRCRRKPSGCALPSPRFSAIDRPVRLSCALRSGVRRYVPLRCCRRRAQTNTGVRACCRRCSERGNLSCTTTSCRCTSSPLPPCQTTRLRTHISHATRFTMARRACNDSGGSAIESGCAGDSHRAVRPAQPRQHVLHELGAPSPQQHRCVQVGLHHCGSTGRAACTA